ncbi:MAG: hypothetical protein J3Q66DRAFT_370722 [Benniella sp.]|nr:MAG: hypothetical protein J3Q66DRAFT_370722 [Benniella sp.]
MGNMGWLSSIDVQWIASMTSASSQPRTPLKVFGVLVDRISQADWEALINTIDFSTLAELYLESNHFYKNQLKLLVDRIAGRGVLPLPMRVLDFKGSEVKDSDIATREMFAQVQEKAPQMRIRCNDWTL